MKKHVEKKKSPPGPYSPTVIITKHKKNIRENQKITTKKSLSLLKRDKETYRERGEQ